MKTIFKFTFGILISFSAITPLHAKTAREYCPEKITTACLVDIAKVQIEKDFRIKGSFNLEEVRESFATNVANGFFPDNPEVTIALLKEYTSKRDASELRWLAKAFAKIDNHAQVRELFLTARQHQINGSKLIPTVMRLLTHSEKMAEAGDLDLPRETHTNALKSSNEEFDVLAPFNDGFYVARLIALYGWPEDTKPWFESLYERVSEIQERSIERGFVLIKFIKFATIIEDEVLAKRAKADLLTFYEDAPSDVSKSIHLSEVDALAEAGLKEEAKAKAREYGITLDDAHKYSSTLFLGQESVSVPNNLSNKLRRYNGMISALRTKQIKAQFILALSEEPSINGKYEILERLLPQITDVDTRSVAISGLISHYLLDEGDLDKAADIIITNKEIFSSSTPKLVVFSVRYLISRTAAGLWENGDKERAATLSDLVLKLWMLDQNKSHSGHGFLVTKLSKFSQDGAIEKWLQASDTLSGQIDILVSAFEGAIEAGDYERGQIYFERAEVLASELKEVYASELKNAAKTNTLLSIRAVSPPYVIAFQKLEDAKLKLVRTFAQKDDLTSAKRVWEERGARGDWRTHLALAQAEERAGDLEALELRKYQFLDDLLRGAILKMKTEAVIKYVNSGL